MKLDVPYKFLDLTPNKELMEFDFSQITEAQWNENMIVRNVVPQLFGEIVMFPILNFPIQYWSDPTNHAPLPINNAHPVWALLYAEIQKLEKLYDATAKIAVLDGMAPGTQIYPHFDKMPIYSIAHRIHLPIVTHPDVTFYIDNEPHHFEAGTFFEFDNRRVHAVQNNSDIFRIHLIVDLIPNKLSL